MADSSTKTPWQVIALASGACAAFNGVFAKLTTDELTSSWAASIAEALGTTPSNASIDYGIRCVVFALSFLFSSVMWGLFTRALSLAPSAVHANVVNTSSNFIIAALLGVAVFGERLPPQWWLGAALLITGSVIIGRQTGSPKAKGD
ncbi:hypothetical protein EJ06DRAFT_483172 [Trichodelitschia bisporula]|uniref:EamA domain-containing protein n=1 Tax=Trichodelitschia bisporula TaxID=703511 RepID=A0A6G1HL20_9PEZI|nr:hypothetical protein EJ06DRAFT_483172 [Trichodelitschia bisporula]